MWPVHTTDYHSAKTGRSPETCQLWMDLENTMLSDIGQMEGDGHLQPAYLQRSEQPDRKDRKQTGSANRWGRGGGSWCPGAGGGRSQFRKMKSLGLQPETASQPPPWRGGGGPAEETEGEAHAPLPHGSTQGQGQAQGHGHLGRAGWATVYPPNGNKEKSVPDNSLLICRNSM